MTLYENKRLSGHKFGPELDLNWPARRPWTCTGPEDQQLARDVLTRARARSYADGRENSVRETGDEEFPRLYIDDPKAAWSLPWHIKA